MKQITLNTYGAKSVGQTKPLSERKVIARDSYIVSRPIPKHRIISRFHFYRKIENRSTKNYKKN